MFAEIPLRFPHPASRLRLCEQHGRLTFGDDHMRPRVVVTAIMVCLLVPPFAVLACLAEAQTAALPEAGSSCRSTSTARCASVRFRCPPLRRVLQWTPR